MSGEPPRARDAIGMPVPPSWAVRAADTARAGLGRVHDRMAPPANLVLDRMLGMVDAKALYAAVALEIPDRLASGPHDARELAEPGADVDALERLLRFLVSRGIFAVDRRGRFSNNAVSDVLRVDHPWSWRDWALFMGSDWSWSMWNALPERVRTATPASEVAFGEPFFGYVNETNPDAGRAFNGAMTAAARLQALLVVEAVDLSTERSVCDIGGGTGSWVAGLLAHNPHLRGVVYDLPALAGEANELLHRIGLDDRCRFEGGDFFESVPSGHDVYVLSAVLHDWEDERDTTILSNVRAAMPSGARVLVVERPVRESTRARADFARFADMLMLVYGDGGRERTVDEYERLFARAGLRIADRTTLASLFEVFELRVAS